jgi:hypothetical protein
MRQLAAAPAPEPPAPGAQPGATQPAPTASAAPAARCSERAFSISNQGRVCYDERPTPQGTLEVAIPEVCGGRATPAVVVVQVGADGQVIGAPSVRVPGSCREFGARAQAYAGDLTFRAARKGGQPVTAWTEVTIRPARQ